MLNIQTLSTIQFSYYKRGRPRPSKSVLDGRLAAAASAPKEMSPENKTRIQPKRRAAASSGNQGNTAALIPPRLPDPIMSPPVQPDNYGNAAIPRLPDSIMLPPTSQQGVAVPMTAVPTTATTKTSVATTNAVPVAVPNHMTHVATPSSNNKNEKSLQTFPFILARLLQELDKNHLEGLIHWNPTGTSVMLRTHHVNQEEMSRLQPYFAHGSVAIIKRQMDHYQFKKIKRQE